MQDWLVWREKLNNDFRRGLPHAWENLAAFDAQVVRVANTLPFPAESYNSQVGYSASWGSFPHSTTSGYIVYQILNMSLIDAGDTAHVPAQDEGDDADNDCDGETDEGCQMPSDVCSIDNVRRYISGCSQDKGMDWFIDLMISILTLMKESRPSW